MGVMECGSLDRNILIDKFISGLSTNEIMIKYNLPSTEDVRQRICRARKAIIEMWGGVEEYVWGLVIAIKQISGTMILASSKVINLLNKSSNHSTNFFLYGRLRFTISPPKTPSNNTRAKAYAGSGRSLG